MNGGGKGEILWLTGEVGKIPGLVQATDLLEEENRVAGSRRK